MDHAAIRERLAAIPLVDFEWYRKNEHLPLFFYPIKPAILETIVGWGEAVSEDYPNGGASGVEMMTLLSSFILSSQLTRIVQTGHYLGFSSLVLGGILQSAGQSGKLYSVDVSKEATDFARSWIQRASLTDTVMLSVGDSAAPEAVDEAADFLGGSPQCVYIDSSHQYEHTRRELSLWYNALQPGGLIVMHDISRMAASFDSTHLGGSHRAATEFLTTECGNGVLLNGGWSNDDGAPVYTDLCGFGLIQKPYR